MQASTRTSSSMSLVHHDAALYGIFGGKEAMIDSPLLNDLIAEKVAQGLQKAVLALLEDRFGPVPLDIVQRVKEITDTDHLLQLNKRAARCPEPGALRQDLGA